ncbi:MAG: hypothetical protein C0497_16160 [Gemmatimonas sp.]|nr:hypothetical protein [Gemmatimonas sp.]
MERFLDWWGYLVIAVLPGAGFVFGVAWARREFRAGRDPMLTSESWWQRRRRRHQLLAEMERRDAEAAAMRRALRSPEHGRGVPAEAEYRVPTPV